MSEEDDFSKFMEEETIKPIDHKTDDNAPEAIKPFEEKIADYKPPEPERKRASSEENLDPVLQAHAREIKAEEERKQKIRERNAALPEDQVVPEHLMDTVIDDDRLNRIGKGQTLDLISKVPSLRKLYIGAGWKVKSLDEQVDIDLSVFLLNKNDQTSRDTDFVFYNQLTAYDSSVKHEGDNRTGAAEGDEEGIFIDLNGLPYDIVKIMIVFSVYDELEIGYNFGLVRNLYVRLTNREYNEEIVRFVLDDDEYKDNTAIYVAGIIREGPRWILETLGTGIGRGGLPNVATRYGIIVKELQSSG